MAKVQLFLFIFVWICFQSAFANAPKVGRKAAAKYFQNEGRKSRQEIDLERLPASEGRSVATDDHYLTIGISTYLNSDAYKWGRNGKEENVGRAGIDMSYRLGAYSNSVDEGLRVSYSQYDVAQIQASKLSLMYALTLPDAGSQSPLYFGFAGGPGIFFKQVDAESSLSLDYQLFFGLRLFDIYEQTGFYIEGGLKNHLHLTSDGQLNGTYISAGAVFTF